MSPSATPACHTEWRSMLPNATPATQTAAASTATTDPSQPSAISATPATHKVKEGVVCEGVVCERVVCGRVVCVSKLCVWENRRRTDGTDGTGDGRECTLKNKNPTQICGEQQRSNHYTQGLAPIGVNMHSRFLFYNVLSTSMAEPPIKQQDTWSIAKTWIHLGRSKNGE